MFSLPKSEVPAQCIWSSFALDIFSAFINLYNHLFTSVWAHGYLFCTLGYKPMLLYFVAQIALALAIGRSFSCTLWRYHLYFFSTCLHSGTTTDHRLVLYTSCLSPCQHIYKGLLLIFIGEQYQKP